MNCRLPRATMNKLIYLGAACLLLLDASVAVAKPQKEAYYTEIWCDANNGKENVRSPQNTYVDCLTREYAVEVDFDTKWAECIGQALHYAVQFNRRPACLVILRNIDGKTRRSYLERLESTIDGYGLGIVIFIIEAKDYPTR